MGMKVGMRGDNGVDEKLGLRLVWGWNWVE